MGEWEAKLQSILSRELLDISNSGGTRHLRQGRNGVGNGPCQTERDIWRESPDLRMVSQLVRSYLTAQNMDSAERKNKIFPFLRTLWLLWQSFPRSYSLCQRRQQERKLHLSDIWILSFPRDPVTEKRPKIITEKLLACCYAGGNCIALG